MKAKQTTQSFCRECGQVTWHNVVASRSRREIEVDDEPPVFADVVYEFLQCCGCDCVTMRSTLRCKPLYHDDTIVSHFPPSSTRRRPVWESNLPYPVYSLLREIYDALHAGGLRLAMVGARTIVDMVILAKVGDVGSFATKLNALQKQGFIGEKNREILFAALDAGSAVAHRGHKFPDEVVNQVMDIVENMLQAIYVLPSTAEAIKKATPPRKKKI